MKKNIYITTPIYYVNGEPHIGHFYCSLLADTFIRFHKMFGNNLRILTGTDEHGQKIQRSAESKNMHTQTFCDINSDKFRQLAIDFDFSFSHNDFENGENFIRTTDKKHKNFVQKIWIKLYENNWIYKGKYCGYYAIRDEAFYDENELIDGKAPTGADVEWKEEECYFFKLSLFEKLLLNLYDKDQEIIIPDKKSAEITSFLSQGLQDLCISRLKKKDFSWGIEVPNDKKHVIYVWLDALFNYISALNENDLDIFWKDKENCSVNHFVGKEIIRFHAIYWPAFLIAIKHKPEEIEKLQKNDIMPLIYDQIYVHGWWTNDGEKISKSIGTIVDPYEEITFLEEKFNLEEKTAIDYFKYFCLSSIPFGNDADYSRNRLIETINSQLVNNIGNLMQRSCSFLAKNFNDKLQNVQIIDFFEKLLPEDRNFIINITKIDDLDLEDFIFQKALPKSDFYSIIKIVNEICNRCNEKMEKMAPWMMLKDKKIEETFSFLVSIAIILQKISKILIPIIPYLARKMQENLNSLENNSLEIVFPRLKILD